MRKCSCYKNDRLPSRKIFFQFSGKLNLSTLTEQLISAHRSERTLNIAIVR
nr:MAG TPA: hypothetical protein [Caudoviricetes sp.]